MAGLKKKIAWGKKEKGLRVEQGKNQCHFHNIVNCVNI